MTPTTTNADDVTVRQEADRTRRALVSFSTDIEDPRVLRVQFDRRHDDRDRAAILFALNAAVSAHQSAGEDTERLDWLDQVNRNTNERNGTRYGWRYDINHNRAALTDHNYPPRSVREAIDEARKPAALAIKGGE